MLAAEGLDRIVLDRLHLPQTEARMDAWIDLVDRIRHPTDEVTIHVVGKYVGYEDSYKSLNEALYHGGFKHRLRVNIRWVEAEALEQPGGEQLLDGAHGILVPGGFGDRGTRGMMRAAEIARERNIPYFGICYGFQWAAVEYARHVGGPRRRRLDRVQPRHADQADLQAARPARRRRPRRHDAARDVSLRAQARLESRELYGEDVIQERHRHRYEFNCLYEKALTESGLEIVGRSLDGKFVEIVELPTHPWYVAVQFHPEFKSKPLKPHPLFAGFVEASHRPTRARRGRSRRRPW